MRLRFFVAAVMLSASLAARADITFDLSNVQLSFFGTPAGTLTGSFTTNDAMTAVESVDIVAPALSPFFPGLTYTLADSVVTAETSILIQLDTPGSADELRFDFSGAGLTATGATLNSASYEFEGASRVFATGSVVAEAPAGSGILKIAYPNASGADNAFQGALDGIAIYDVALTPAQVKARFDATRERPSTLSAPSASSRSTESFSP